MLTSQREVAILKDLGDGLILRRSTSEDADRLSNFNAHIHSDAGWNKPDDRIGVWTRDLLTRPHPTMSVDDFTIVEEASTGRIVSSMNLISQTWSYEGVEFGVGRPELVGTLPEFRNKGLVRAQFEEVHRWSEERGHLVQAITGIPYFYRQFGYEMALELGGGRVGFVPHIPLLPNGEKELYRIRPAREADLGFVHRLYGEAQKRSLISAVRDLAIWRYELNRQSERNLNRYELLIVEDAQSSEPVGFLAHPWFVWGKNLFVATMYEILPGTSWLDVTPSVIRSLWKTGQKIARKEGKRLQAFGFWHGTSHPVYEVFPEHLPFVRNDYAWYLRVPDLPAFLQRIVPVMERRLAESYIPGYSGMLDIGFYRDGLHLRFDHGKLSKVEAWRPSPAKYGDATFPDQTFLHLVFGHHSLDELERAYPDCNWENDEVRLLLTTLFPKKASSLLGIA